jgi:transcriptional regulator with XRE-family HTH domain
MWAALGDRDYRHAYAEGHVSDFLTSQIHSMRTSRGWSQDDLADKAGVSQPMISGWERSCEGVRLTSLHKLAEAFDVALLVKFAPFSQLAKEAIGARADTAVPSFDDDSRAAIAFPAVRFTVQPAPRRRGRENGNEKPYVRQTGLPDNVYAVIRS